MRETATSAVLAGLCCLIPLGVIACEAAPRNASSNAASPGASETLEFSLTALGGGEVALSDYRGKVVLLDFWATWCKPCHEQARILAPLYQELAGDGVVFLAIDSGEDEATVRRFVERNPFPYPVLLDEDDSVGLGLDILALPTVVVVDRAGRVVYMNTGIADAETLRRELARAGASSAGSSSAGTSSAGTSSAGSAAAGSESAGAGSAGT